MAGKWRAKTLGDLAELHNEQINPGEWPDRQFCHFSIPAFGSGQAPIGERGDLIGSHKFTVPHDAILVSRLNSRIPRVWEPTVAGHEVPVCSTEFLVLRPRPGTDRRFLKYVCLSPLVRAEMQARVTGTSGSHQRVRPQDALGIKIEVPEDINEQRAIAHVLGTLDDKIELNRRISETLEAMARVIFKAWFVDFEPVRANMQGRWRRGESLPGLPAHLYDLFPDRLVDSELGEIPEWWDIRHVGDIGKIVCGKTPSTKVQEYYSNDVPFITIPDIHNDIFVVSTQRQLSRLGAASQSRKTLPAGSISVRCIATPGLVAITTAASQTNQQINSVIPSQPHDTYYWFCVLFCVSLATT